MKGVLLSDVIEACGGLAGGTNTFALAGADGWATAYIIDFMVQNNAMIALEYFGHPLTADQGYPATLVIPGMPVRPGSSTLSRSAGWSSRPKLSSTPMPFALMALRATRRTPLGSRATA